MKADLDSMCALGASVERPELREELARVAEARAQQSDATPVDVERARKAREEASAAEWPELIPIGAPEAPPPFPVDHLPHWLARFVIEVAEQLQVPLDLVGMCVLSVLSTICARRFWISPRTGWKQPALLWTLTMLASGNRKTAAFDLATAPLRAFVKRRSADLHNTIAAEGSQLRVLKSSLARAEKRASEAKAPEERTASEIEATEFAMRVATFRLTPKPLLFLSEATPERLEEMLAEHGRAAVLADEAGLLGLLAGRYGKSAPNLDPFIQGYEGNTVHVGRMKKQDGSGGDRHAEAAHVTLGLVPQPDVALPHLRSSEAFAATGFLWRFLFSMPCSKVGNRNARAAAASQEVLETYSARIGELLNMSEPLPDCSGDEIPVLHATAEAAEAVLQFEELLEPRLRAGEGDLAGLGSWGSKLLGQLVRLAALLHAAEYRAKPVETPLDLSTMQRALAFAPYFIAHAQAARFEMHVDDNTKQALRALEWMRRRASGGVRIFTRSELHKAIAKNKPVDEIDPLVAFLKRHGAIREIAPPKGTVGAPRKATYEVHPEIGEVADE